MSTLTASATLELDAFDAMAVAELAEARRTVAKLEDRQKAIRAAIMAKMDAVGATVGTIGGAKVLSIVESTRSNISATKVRDLYPSVWEDLGSTTDFRSIRLDAPSVTV